jgi:hypothetical protein
MGGTNIDYNVASEVDDCPKCAGAGYVINCMEGYCEASNDGGCGVCERQCDLCNARLDAIDAAGHAKGTA